MSMMMELLTNNASSPDPLHQEVVYKRPLAYSKMEHLIKEMQDMETGVPVRSQKIFLSSIPAAFAGYDIIEWLMERLNIEDSVEAIHLANLLCQHGYFFPVGTNFDNKHFSVKDDSSLYRFQTPYYWPSSSLTTDNNEDYAIYLSKRSQRNKQKHALDDYEMEALTDLRKNLHQKWDFIAMQADEQVRIGKDRKKVEKQVLDSQERAFWRVLRPPPGVFCCVETPPMYKADFHLQIVKQIRRTNILEDLRAEVDLLRTSCIRTRIKVSQALESLASHCESYVEHDPFLIARQPSNPWHSDNNDTTYWVINAPLVDVPTERRVKKWSISMEDLVFDMTGLREFTLYLQKEYCHENIRFWLAVRDLRYGPICQLRSKAQQIYNEFLSPGAPCEINIDMRTMEAVQKELNYLTPSRFTFDPAADHVYLLLLKKDCYPRFIRSEHYKNILANALTPSQIPNASKKRLDKFLSFVAPGKKKSSTTAIPHSLFHDNNKTTEDLLFSNKNDNNSDVLSNECPYRGDLIPCSEDGSNKFLPQASMDDVCPWESIEEKKPSTSTAAVLSKQTSVASSNKTSNELPEFKNFPTEKTENKNTAENTTEDKIIKWMDADDNNSVIETSIKSDKSDNKTVAQDNKTEKEATLAQEEQDTPSHNQLTKSKSITVNIPSPPPSPPVSLSLVPTSIPSPPISPPPIDLSPPLSPVVVKQKATSSSSRKQSREEDVCPWDHENGTLPESETFVKTYSTLGYL